MNQPSLRRVAVLVLVLASLSQARSPAHAAREQPVRLEVTLDHTTGGTRVVLTHAEPVAYTIDASDGRIEVRYDRPIDVKLPELARGEDRILERLRVRGDRNVVLVTGAEFRSHETFELRNPFRLVLDLAGTAAPGTRGERVPVAPAYRAIVVLDPGHGGIEHGATGPSGLKEKEVTLDLARRLRTRLTQLDRTLGVVLTRDEDRLLGLDERTAIANHNHAELFLSIHLNAAPGAKVSGAETYFLSTQATDDEARRLAAVENRAAAASAETAATGTAERNLDLVLWDLAQNQFLADSSALAESVQAQLNRLTGTRDRGVRQAPFRVLMGATMPAILVEVGFISNPDEETKLKTPEYREQVVAALAESIAEYLKRLDRLSDRSGVGAGAPTMP